MDAKVKRARVHLDTFYEDARKYLEHARPRFVRKTNQENSQHWLVFWVDDPIPPIELSVLIGEFHYDLRSALDNLICGLVRKGNPTSSCAGRQFPIFANRDKYLADGPGMLRGVPKPARALIDTLQPFCRGEKTAQQDPLWILSVLNNRDKHRAANLTLAYNKDVELLIPLKTGASLHVRLDRALYAGDVDTVPLPGAPSAIDDNVQMQVVGRSVLTFRSDDPWSERPVDGILAACLRYVEDRVIPGFKPFFR